MPFENLWMAEFQGCVQGVELPDGLVKGGSSASYSPGWIFDGYGCSFSENPRKSDKFVELRGRLEVYNFMDGFESLLDY